MFLDDLVEFLQKEYKDVRLYRDEAGHCSIYIRENGVTLVLQVFRFTGEIK